MNKTRLFEILSKHQAKIVSSWTEGLKSSIRVGLITDDELKRETQEFFTTFLGALQSSKMNSVNDLLGSLSRSRSLRGFSPSETANFVLTFKKPVFIALRAELGNNADGLADEMMHSTEILDGLALFTTEVYQKSREEVITRQQSDMLELSTPVVELWDNILALPMIGTLDSSRSQTVMENLLQRIVDTGSEIAIIDITGVPTVDTLVAQHLLKTVTAARLMGAECIISGIRPQIAATIVHLGVDLGNVITKASLADAFRLALQKTGQTIGTKAIRV